MFAQHTDLAPNRDSTSRLLPWIIGLMVYLAGLAVSVTMVFEQVIDRWSAGLKGSVTVVIEPSVNGEDIKTEARIETALRLILTTPGISSAIPLANADVAELIEPWLGKDALSLDLPIPRLIDVTLEPNRTVDLAALTHRLETAVPGIQIDDHKVWLQSVLRLARTFELIAILVVILIAAAAGATVMFATRARLAVQCDVIEVLHLIGARDTYIARQFQGIAVSMALWGGLLGLSLTGLTVLGLWILTHDLEGSLLPAVGWNPPFVAGLALLPLAGVIIAAVTARYTVMRHLSRML